MGHLLDNEGNETPVVFTFTQKTTWFNIKIRLHYSDVFDNMAWTIGVYWLLMGLSGFHSISSTFAIVHQQVINDTTPLISNSTLSTWPPPPGVLREAAPITSLMLAQLELTPDTHLYAQAGRQALVRFSLRNLDSLPRRFAISLQEHRGRPEDDSFQPQLSDQRPFLNPNETRVITVFLQIPPLSTTLEEERPTPTYTIEVQPLGTTTSGAANMLVRRFNFPVIENTDEEVAVKYLSDWTVPHCQTSEQVVSPTCLNVSQDLQKCGKYTWRGQLQIQVGFVLNTANEANLIFFLSKPFVKERNLATLEYL